MTIKPTLNSNTNTSLSRFPLLYAFFRLWNGCSDAFVQSRTHQLGLEIALGLLSAFGRRTISRGICARARQFYDWSKYYRFFSKCKWNHIILKHKILEYLAAYLSPSEPFVVAVDDTYKPKSGKKIPSSGFFYDSKSPPFARSFKWQLRFLTLSALLTPHGPIAAVKGILINFKLAPTLGKPKRNASDAAKAYHKKLTRNWTITSQLTEQILLLRAQMDAILSLAHRLLVVVADASYANKTVIRNLPQRCVLISRIRKNLALYSLPDNFKGKGRKRIYGDKLPTPEQLRQNDEIPYQTCQIFACGKWHELKFKTTSPVLWKSAGGDHLCRLIVIAPLHYRLAKCSKLLYRRPAYLLVSDLVYPVHLAIQHYFHRWEIEVNHRNAKTHFGVGDAQVWNRHSVARQFAFAAFIQSLLELAALDAYGPGRSEHYVPLAKWRNDSRARPSALDVVTRLRIEILMNATGGACIPFQTQRGLSPNAAKYARAASIWLAQTVPKGLSESFWSSIIYADA